MPETSGSSLYLNRELSWLAFNTRVLHEALDPRTPLLERVKFLSIFSGNLDEFYMVRIAGLRRQAAAGVVQTPPDGLTPLEQLDALYAEVAQLGVMQRRCLDDLLEELAPHGIKLVGVKDLTPAEWGEVDEYFESQVFPVLTPLAVDPGHPFPYISNLSLSLAVEIRDPETGSVRFARVKVPRSLPRWVRVNGRGHRFVPLEQVIGANLGALFAGMEVAAWYVFRITRYSDLEIPVEEPEDLLGMIEEQVFRRRFGEVIRVEVEDGMPEHLRALLLDELREDGVPEPGRLSDHDIQNAGRLLDLSDLMTLAMLDVPALRDPPFAAITPLELRDDNVSIFDVVREADLLLHHPFDSFATSVERYIEEAADDPQVLAIKLTLYRTSGDTALVDALVRAAQRGKQVAVIVELKARFDEANNITWARQLEDAGVHVAFGSATLKTHAKTALVVRRETDGIRRYVHLGSGNYNSKTARLYTDVGLITCSPSIGADVSDLFNSLTGYSRQRLYRKLLIAPVNLRARFIELIRREAQHAAEGRPARIIGKMNALVDAEVPGRRRHRSDRARHLLSAARASGRERQYQRDQHHRPLSRALAHLALLQRRGGGVLPRLVRLDAAELRSPCGGGGAGGESGAARAFALAALDISGGQPPGVGAGVGRRVDAARAGRHRPRVARALPAQLVGRRARHAHTFKRCGAGACGRRLIRRRIPRFATPPIRIVLRCEAL
jgi:polyphosphate kinase